MPQDAPPVNQALSTELIEELDLGSARGGQAGQGRDGLTVELVRALTVEDLPAIQNPPPVAAGLPVVKQLKQAHHRLAELIAQGKPGTEIALVTGYSQSYISNIQNDPAFAELVQYYSAQKASIFIDAAERLRLLGLDATERLHDKLRDEAEPWSKRELMELIDMALVKPGSVAAAKIGAGAPPGASLSLEVKFVGARPGNGPEVEATYVDVTPSSNT